MARLILVIWESKVALEEEQELDLELVEICVFYLIVSSAPRNTGIFIHPRSQNISNDDFRKFLKRQSLTIHME